MPGFNLLIPTRLLAVIGALSLGTGVRAAVSLPEILGDGMVLQRGLKAPFWGKADPGEKISVKGDWQRAAIHTVADKNGRWFVRLPLPAPGGPHVISIQGKNEIILRDVLIGDVWICSGQSNMEMPVGPLGGYSGVTNWQAELNAADFPRIRLFTVANAAAASPQFGCSGRWSHCSANSAKTFSATGFFFGRELFQTLNVPIGLVSADYGGTVAEAWTSEATLRNFPEFKDDLELVRTERDAADELVRLRGERTAAWLSQIEPLDGGDAFAAADLDDSSWKTIQTPGVWSGELADFDGFVWLRFAFDLPPAWTNSDLTLEAGAIDDMDFTFINGTRIGQTIGEDSWSAPRNYKVPKSSLKPGRNIIAIRVLDTGGQGGISGPIRLRAANAPDSLSLHGEWRFSTGARAADLPRLITPTRIHANTPTVLFNAMIAPVAPFGIRGVIWYQGESNIGREEQYRRLFPALISDWRNHWGQGAFPFYYVQVAPFRYPNPGKASALREAQMLSLTTPRTGMAIVMDSDSNNLHPVDKQKVGHRLALLALAKTYGQKNIVHSGPIYRRMRIQGNRIRLYFDHAGGGLIARDNKLEHFTIAGPDKNFVPAHAEIDGSTIVVSNPDINDPIAVRYAWADHDESSFANTAGLPASSFRTDVPRTRRSNVAN